MTAIIIPRRHYTQPQGRVQIAPELGRDLVYAPVINGFSDVNGPVWSPIENTETSGGSLTSGGIYQSFDVPPFSYPLSYSVLCRFRSNTVGQSLAGIGNFGGANCYRTYNNTTGGIATQSRSTNAQGSFQAISVNLLTIGWMLITTVIRDPALGLGNSLFINKNLSSSWNDPASMRIDLFDNATVRLDPLSRSTSTNGVEAAFAAFWNRELSRDEHFELVDNPWQLFRADPVRIYSLPTGAISINSILASNITQTGARITLGLTR